MSDFCLHLLGELAEAGHRPIDELPKLRPVDLLVAVHAQFDFLPRAAKVLAPHPRLGAVERQFGHVVQRLQVELLDQLLALEGVPRRAKLHLQQPLLAGDGVEEPAVGLLRRANLHHAPRVPVGLGKQRRKGVRSNLCEAPSGPFRQIGPDPFSLL